MKFAYPVILTPADDMYVVDVPDLGIGTQGTDLTDAIRMARDAIGLWGICEEDEGKALPEPSELSTVTVSGDQLVTLVDVDFAEYRRRHDLRTVRKNCTIPSWLNDEAERAGINFSAVLQGALKQELHLT